MRVYQFRHIRAAVSVAALRSERLRHVSAVPWPLCAAGSAPRLRRSALLAARRGRAARDVEVVVTLDAPGARARRRRTSRVLSAAARQRRLDLARADEPLVPAQRSRRRRTRSQRATRARDPAARTSAGATASSLNGLAVVAPRRAAAGSRASRRRARLPERHATARALDRSARPDRRARALGRRPASTAGDGHEDRDHRRRRRPDAPVLRPGRATRCRPASRRGRPPSRRAKVIVARAFPPRGADVAAARTLPFDPAQSEHATHVAGIAAGNRPAPSPTAARPLSGVAPRAYIGNYKVLTVPTDGVGLNGNAPEIAAGIEAAVADGMDVINLSLGEPEIEPSPRPRRAARSTAPRARASLPSSPPATTSTSFGTGSVGSPGSARAGDHRRRASTTGRGPATRSASFSSGGPTPVSLQLKPDVTAPGRRHPLVGSRARRLGACSAGRAWPRRTSPAPPRCSASGIRPGRSRSSSPRSLTATGHSTARIDGAPPREGGGSINVARADTPARLRGAERASRSASCAPAPAPTTLIALTDAGGGAGTWTVASRARRDATSVHDAVDGAGRARRLGVTAASAAGARRARASSSLRRGADVRRIPYWLRVEPPRSPAAHATLRGTGHVLAATTVGRPSRASPRTATRTAPRSTLAGPEQVFRVPVRAAGRELRRRVLGARRPSAARRRATATRTASSAYPALPFNLNPYLARLRRPAAGRRARSVRAPARTTSSSTPRAPRRPRSRSASGSTT